MISEGKDHPLSFKQRFGLRMHLMMCALCRGYEKNLELLGRIAARAGDAIMSRFATETGDEGLVLSPVAKQRIKEELKKTNPSD